ncbi:MAG: mechanosensitive ion channel [Alphaproteobacteria bacterium]|nr:mechanosensitive ion channel [Alphaproteobacteria bacterium]
MPHIHWQDILYATGYLMAIFAGGALCGWLFSFLAEKIAQQTEYRLDNLLARRMRAPLVLLMPTIFYFTAMHYYRPPALAEAPLSGSMRVLAVIAAVWIAMRAASATADILQSHFDVNTANNLRARRIHTQISIIRRLVHFIIFVIGVASLFMMSDALRGFGMSLLASAGVAGLVIGLSAQKILGNLLAGIQIALTQPIRIDDVVIVEGEWGKIEEITLTYVVVRIWDLRRLVVPISYFIEKPFQNWTRTSADILGTVSLFTDYTVPLDRLRAKLDEILKDTPLWDEKVSNIQLVECKQDTVEARVLISARNASDAWDLRCLIREKMVDFIQREFPDALPRTRAEITKNAA